MPSAKIIPFPAKPKARKRSIKVVKASRRSRMVRYGFVEALRSGCFK